MKNLKKKLSLLIAACLCMVGFAYAKEDKEDEPALLCKISPLFCGVTTQGGNGGGLEPPKG